MTTGRPDSHLRLENGFWLGFRHRLTTWHQLGFCTTTDWGAHGSMGARHMRELLQALTIDQGFKSFNFCMEMQGPQYLAPNWGWLGRNIRVGWHLGRFFAATSFRLKTMENLGKHWKTLENLGNKPSLRFPLGPALGKNLTSC